MQIIIIGHLAVLFPTVSLCSAVLPIALKPLAHWPSVCCKKNKMTQCTKMRNMRSTQQVSHAEKGEHKLTCIFILDHYGGCFGV